MVSMVVKHLLMQDYPQNLNDRVQQATFDTRNWFPHLDGNLSHMVIAFGGEAGEVLNAYKKWDRSEAIDIDDATRAKMADELADVLVYLFCIAGMLEVDLEEEYDRKREFNIGRFGAGAGRGSASSDSDS